MNNELMHYGVKRRSGRYPFGSGSRPYQSMKKGISGLVQKHKKKQQIKKRNENLKKAREKAAENRRLAADKDRVLKSGTAREVMRYKGKLTNDELRNAVTRLNLEKQLKEYASNEVKSNMQKIDQAMKSAKQVGEWAKTGTDLYNQMARIYNSTENGRRRPMTLVGQTQSNQQQQRR